MNAPTFEQASVLSGRQMVLVAVVGLHALAISSLMAMRMASNDVPITHVFKPVTPITPVDTPPPPAVPRIDQVDTRAVVVMRLPDMPAPVVQLEQQWSDPDGVSTPEIALVGPFTDAPPLEAVASTELQSRATRSPDEFYPALSQRLGEQGAAVVRVCVAPSGRIEGAPTIERSSGSRSLDGAAVRWAAEALAFSPATRNGAPVSACKGFRVNFTLR